MKKDWKSFYEKDGAPHEPSSFAKFFMEQNIEGNKLVDLGCGNARDTAYLGEKYKAYGVDQNGPVNMNIYRYNWKDAMPLIFNADIVYSRFFLHAISELEMNTIITRTEKYFVAEARAVGDKPVLYPKHKRFFVDGDKLIRTLQRNNFDILYYQKGSGLAKYKDEDPLVVRVIAVRKN